MSCAHVGLCNAVTILNRRCAHAAQWRQEREKTPVFLQKSRILQGTSGPFIGGGIAVKYVRIYEADRWRCPLSRDALVVNLKQSAP